MFYLWKKSIFLQNRLQEGVKDVCLVSSLRMVTEDRVIRCHQSNGQTLKEDLDIKSSHVDLKNQN